MDREEFEKALMHVAAYDRLTELEDGAIGELFPEVHAMVGFGGGDTGHKDLWWHTKLVVQQCVPNEAVRWAALFHDVGKPPTFSRETGKVSFHNHEAVSAKLWNQAARRIGWFTDDERKRIKFLVYNLGRVEAYYVGWTDSAIRRLSNDVGEHWDDLMALAWADSTTKHDHKRSKHHLRMADLKTRRAAIVAEDSLAPALPKGLGTALMAEMDMEPGKELGTLMSRLKAAVEAGELPRSAEYEIYFEWCQGKRCAK